MFDNLFNLNNPVFLGIMVRFVINLGCFILTYKSCLFQILQEGDVLLCILSDGNNDLLYRFHP